MGVLRAELNVKSPVTSIVIPTKGRVTQLESCLSALCASDSDPQRFEVVVANDGGGREVEDLVAAFVGRLAVRTVTPEASGPSAARNAGAAAARGGHLAFTDDDCEPEPGWLSALERALAANPGAAVGGRVRNGLGANLGAVASQAVVDALHAQWNRSADGPRFFASSNVAFPADRFGSIGGFDEGFRYAEDRELCERWVRAGHRFVHAPDAVVVHMRALGLREFVVQHHGYGRGAHAFHRALEGRPRLTQGGSFLRELGRQIRSCHNGQRRIAVAGYAAMAELATATGFAREAAGTLSIRRTRG